MSNIEKARHFPALWAGAINAGELEKVVGLYNGASTLTPTFSTSSVNDRDSLNQYFTNLGSRKGVNVSLQDDTINCQHCGANIYILTGTYTFGFEVDGNMESFPSRFTFVVNMDDEQPILHHHSSQAPQALS